ncbi:hypothetical protein [Aestuariispira ectoiniformans]|uniref:hypothetical protein n=1 Tax=Aestuariispira ectoiniformans TaxID=2775080 RepID=UPI00223B836E|nr:hypothetical protein [Aestuariispira ectoiniformans]
MSDVKKLIAQAIKGADKSWFNEDYVKQAEAVIRGLKAKGFVVVEEKPTEKQVEAGKDALQSGRYRPSDVVTVLYQAMVRAR